MDLLELQMALFGFLYSGTASADQPAAEALDDAPDGAAVCDACGHSQEQHTGPGFGCAAWVLDEHDEGAYCGCGRQDQAAAGQPVSVDLAGFAPAGDPADEEPPTAEELGWARADLAEHVAPYGTDPANYAQGWLSAPNLYRTQLRKGLALAAVAAETTPAEATEPARPAGPKPRSSLRDVNPDSAEGRVAALLSGQLAGHIGDWSIARHTGGLICVIRHGTAAERVGHLRAVHALLPDASIGVLETDGWRHVDLTIVRDSITARIGFCVGPGPVWVELQAETRAWLAEVGAEVTR
jgi:hypothetical protein